MTAAQNVTVLLRQAASGDRKAFDEAFGLVYAELRTLAHAQLRRESVGHTLNTCALVHEAYVKLGEGVGGEVRDRSHFLAIAATAMRRILVDYARRAHAEKRGAAAHPVSLDILDALLVDQPDAMLLDVNEALDRLSALDRRQAQVVECRFFGGLTEEETAEALSIGLRTVKRDWAKARSWLYRELHPDSNTSFTQRALA